MPKYIDADAVIKNLPDDLPYKASVKRVLIQAPEAEIVEVKCGEWIKQKPNLDAMRKFHELGIGKAMSENSIHWTCSCCGTWGTPRMKYCSECGAKMKINI